MGVAVYIAGDFEFFEFVPVEIKHKAFHELQEATGLTPVKRESDNYFVYAGYVSDVDTNYLENRIAEISEKYSAAFKEFNFDYFVLSEPEFTISFSRDVTEPNKVAKIIARDATEQMDIYDTEFLKDKLETAINILKGVANDKLVNKLKDLLAKL